MWDERRDQTRMATEPLMKPQQQQSCGHRTATQQAPYSLVAQATQAREMRMNNQKGATLFWSRCRAVQEALHLLISWTTRSPEQQHLCMPGTSLANIRAIMAQRILKHQSGSYAGLVAQCIA